MIVANDLYKIQQIVQQATGNSQQHMIIQQGQQVKQQVQQPAQVVRSKLVDKCS